jgi:hypothetical protein
MIAIAHQHHIYYTLDPIAGIMTPEWVYGAGVKRFEAVDVNPHHPTYGQTRSQPVPWDSTYHKLYRDFLTRLAARYGNDPLLLEVTINGHNTTLEMSMPRRRPDMEQWRQLGWSPELVETDWKSWIDFFAQTFPNTHIGLVLSPMYGESTKRVAESLTSYAVSKYARQLILMTAVLYGRRDQSYMFQTHIVLEYPRVLNAQETISSFLTDPQRQGSMQMFIYNMRQLSPLFVRLWPADAQNVQLCSSILSQYDRARSMSVASLRSELESKGAYTTADTYQGPNGQGGGPQRGRFGRFGGRRNPLMGSGSPFQQGASAQGGYRDQGGTYQGQGGGSYPGENAYPPLNSSPGSDTSSQPNDLSD